MLNNNFLSLLLTFTCSVIWLRINDYAAHRGWVESRISRKIIHIGTGPIFILCWLFFNASPESRWLAAIVPFLITFQFLLVGLGLWKDEAAVQAMARHGDRREILKGPLFYGIIFVIITILFWKESPVGITALMILSGGDGLADIVGRHTPITKLPWNPQKSLGGSLAVLGGGYLLSTLILWIYTIAEVFPLPMQAYLIPLFWVALAATWVESLPIKDIDNITITLASIISGWLIFP